jgi:hypothetical protein
VTNPDLTDEETTALLAELDRIIDGDRYPLSHCIRALKAIRAKIGSEAVRAHCRIPGHSTLSLSGKSFVPPIRRDRHGERDQVDPTPDRLVDSAQRGFMIARDNKPELRGELEKILPHKPGGHLIATGERLDLGFGPMPPPFDLLCRDKTSTTQTGYILRRDLDV